MSELPSESPAFEIRPRLNEEMEYFKEMTLQETERWIESVTKKHFKYPDNPRRSLQDGILLCELVNALKPGSVRKINRLPTPIAFLDNLTVFQNACRYEFGLQESQLFDIKDLEDLSLRGVIESEEELQYETSKRLKNVMITIFWLGKAVRHWYKGPMLDFSVFTDIIDMSHSSQASFRTPSEASFVSSGRYSTDRFSSLRGFSKQSDLAYEKVTKYLESGPVYGSQASLDSQEPVTQFGVQKTDGTRTIGSDFEEENLHLKTRLSGSGHDRTTSPRNVDQKGKVKSPPSTPDRSDGVRSPVSPTGTMTSPLQFVKGDSKVLAETAKQTMQLMQQQSTKSITTPEDDENWEAKLKDWKARRRSQRTSETDDIMNESSLKAQSTKERNSSSVSPTVSEDSAAQNSPAKTVFKKREEEEDTLALFGFRKVPVRPITHSIHFMRPERETGKDEPEKKTLQNNCLAQNQDISEIASQNQSKVIGDEIRKNQQPPLEQTTAPTSLNISLQKINAETVTALEEPNKKFIEKVIKISQRPKHQKGFGFTIRGGKEHGMPIMVDKVHLGGAADVCDLMSNDEIVAINGALLANHYLESVRAVIDQAVHSGQVELTVRRTLDKSCDDMESDVFSEEDLEYSEGQNEDPTQAKLSELLERENARTLTPVPPEDEPPPLPSAPPPPPNWKTFPRGKAPFAPEEDIQFFDDDDKHREEVRTDIQVPVSRSTEVRANEFAKTTDKMSMPEKMENTEKYLIGAESSDPNKHSMLMKRINFFGLKPEDSEEYKRVHGRQNGKLSESEVPEIKQTSDLPRLSSPKKLSVQSEERVFALFVSPSDKSPRHSSSSSQPSPTAPSAFNASVTSTSVSYTGRKDPKEQEKVRKDEYQIENPFRREETEMAMKQQPVKKEIDMKQYPIEFRKTNVEYGIKNTTDFEKNKDVTDQELKTSDRIEKRNQMPILESPTAISTADVPVKLPIQKDESLRFEFLVHEKPTDAAGPTDTRQRHSESSDFTQPFEKSKGWKSMEMLRSFSVNDAVRIDPMVKAREDYLSLMMSRPKPNLEMINRQYFDLGSDLKRMEEWNKKQEQLRQEKFDQDQEKIRQKHEIALCKATALEREKQKQEEQMLEKEMIWKRQLEEIQVIREKELEKKQKEDHLRQKLAEEKARKEREEQIRQRLTEEWKEKEKEREEQMIQKLADQKAEEEKKVLEHPQLTKEKTDGVVPTTTCTIQSGKVEVAFLEPAAACASLEVLPDSVHASSESLCSSTQLDTSSYGDDTSSRNISDREQTTPFLRTFPKNNKEHEVFGVKNNDRAAGTESYQPKPVLSLSHAVVDTKPTLREKPVGMVDRCKDVSPTPSKEKDEPSRSNQLIRDEALLISRRPGGGSQWSYTDPEESSSPSPQPEPVIRKTIQETSASVSVPSTAQSQPWNGRQDTSASSYHQLPSTASWMTAQFKGDEVNVTRTASSSSSPVPPSVPCPPRNKQVLQDICAPPKHRLQGSESWITARREDDDEDVNEARRASVPAPSPVPSAAQQQPWNRKLLQDVAVAPKHRSQDSESWVTEQSDSDESLSRKINLPSRPAPPAASSQPWNRKLLQDISAPPKHRLQSGESWITARSDDEDVSAVIGAYSAYDPVPPTASSQPWNRQLLQDISAPPKHRFKESWITAQPDDDDDHSMPDTELESEMPVAPVRTDSLKYFGSVPSPTAIQVPKDFASAYGQRNCSPTALSAKGDGRAQTYFETSQVSGNGYGQNRLYDNQVHGSLEQLMRNLNQEQIVRTEDHELSLRSASYNATQPSPRSQPYSSDYSADLWRNGGHSSLVSAPAAVPCHRDLHESHPLEPPSEAVDMLFAYHQGPDRQKSPSSSSVDVPSTSEGQKCSGCDKELGFGRCIVLNSLEYCFHPKCFRCSVCRAPFHNQSHHEDIRILASKLHCRNCYTNEEEGLKYSKV